MANQCNLNYKEQPEKVNDAIPFSVEETSGAQCSLSNLSKKVDIPNTDTTFQHCNLESLRLSQCPDKKTTKPPIKVIVMHGNIEQQTVDVLSTPLSANILSLNHLQVTRSLQFAAGDKFSNLFKCVLNNRTSLEAGRVFELALVSESYSLKCKFVIFIPLNSWSYSTSSSAEGALRSGIKNLLERCNMKNVESIAMSAIGTGIVLAFPPETTATIIGEEIKYFGERNPNTTIKEIRLVIKQLAQNKIIFLAYRETLSAMDLGDRIIVCNEQGGTFPSARRGDSIEKQIGGLSLFVVYRDIVDESTNAIVNSTNFKQWSKDSVAHAIFSVTGTDIIHEAQHGHEAGKKVVVTSPGKLKCNWVLHCDCEGSLTRIRTLTDKIFTLCDETGLTSLSIPAFGTGQGKLCPKSVARTMMEAISDLAKKRKGCPSVVRLITYTPFIYYVFCTEFEKHF